MALSPRVVRKRGSAIPFHQPSPQVLVTLSYDNFMRYQIPSEKADSHEERDLKENPNFNRVYPRKPTGISNGHY